jgi:hypothetical protein
MPEVVCSSLASGPGGRRRSYNVPLRLGATTVRPRQAVLSVVAAGALALAGCGSDDDDRSDEAAGATPERSGPVPACEAASNALLRKIEAGLTVHGGGSLQTGYFTRSRDFDNVYMVAAEVQGPGLEENGDVGVWSTNRTNGAGLTYAVDPVAQKFSDWGDADEIAAAITVGDDGVARARKCADFS